MFFVSGSILSLQKAHVEIIKVISMMDMEVILVIRVLVMLNFLFLCVFTKVRRLP